MRSVLKTGIAAILRLIPQARFEQLLKLAVSLRAQGQEPVETLRFLLKMDNYIYGMCGQWAVKYGHGHHVKHRLTGYVDHFAELAAAAGGPILDVGCHTGYLAAAISERIDTQVVGVDISQERIDIANATHQGGNLSYFCADATKGKIGAGGYRTVVLSNVLEHIEERPAFLRSLCQQHQPEKFIIRVPNYERDWRVPLKDELAVEYRSDVTHFIEHRPPELMAELEESGLRILKAEIRWGEIWVVAEPAGGSDA
ncbi:class I SAM-dependent methyltransferase [Aestuariispira insulae]|uniref:Methyltransferase family protein n=1 Tax=Aestuariispira insulae TaxID=1461337 RepID=A0A3D9H451_9PROT|nr:class I SAM-dependent methyltransferase [Aestuariispira insulae]RED44284.1 methyltransferase family protein [Aestuariispira insulae]